MTITTSETVSEALALPIDATRLLVRLRLKMESRLSIGENVDRDQDDVGPPPDAPDGTARDDNAPDGTGPATEPEPVAPDNEAERIVKVRHTARTSTGLIRLPATAMGGVLRSALERRAGGSLDKAFGFVPPAKNEGVHARASRFVFDDLVLDPDITTDERQQVAIDRHRGRGEDGLLRKTERVRADHDKLVTVDFEIHSPDAYTDTALAVLLDELHESGVRIGANTGTGHGHLKLPALDADHVELRRLDLTDADTLLRWIGAEDRRSAAMPPNDDVSGWIAKHLGDLPATPDERRPWTELRFSLRCKPDEPYLVGDPQETGVRPQTLPLPIANGGSGIVGSSIRGALRSRAERIVRTLGAETWDSVQYRTESDTNAEEANDPATRLFGSTAAAGYVIVPDTVADGARPKTFDFLAIDRFTGGGQDKLKFDVQALTGGNLDVTVDLASHEPDLVGLLLLLLLDIATGDLPLGSRTRRGFGTMRGQRLTISWRGHRPSPGAGKDSSGAWCALGDIELNDADRAQMIDGFDAPVRDWLVDAVAAFAQACKAQAKSTIGADANDGAEESG